MTEMYSFAISFTILQRDMRPNATSIPSGSENKSVNAKISTDDKKAF